MCNWTTYYPKLGSHECAWFRRGLLPGALPYTKHQMQGNSSINTKTITSKPSVNNLHPNTSIDILKNTAHLQKCNSVESGSRITTWEQATSDISMLQTWVNKKTLNHHFLGGKLELTKWVSEVGGRGYNGGLGVSFYLPQPTQITQPPVSLAVAKETGHTKTVRHWWKDNC
jgi:hypothetical protein